MRVLHVVKKFPPLIGGDATAVAGLVRAQRRAGDEVHVVTYASPGGKDAGATRVGPPQKGADMDRITFRRLRGMAAMRRWAKHNLTAMRPDVVHAHAADVGYAVGRVAGRGGTPTLLTCHGVWFPSLGRHSFRGSMEVRLIRLGRYRTITAVDAASVAALKSVGFAAARLVPNGVDLEEFEGARARDGPFRFLFAGRHERQKGLDLLLEATAKLRDAPRDPFVVDILGEGSLTAALRARAHDLGLDGVVRFRGALPRAGVVAAFRGSDAFVLPSRSEGFPIVLLEAWAAGLPVIATAVGGVPHVAVPGTAQLVPPEDPAALADAMASMMSDTEERATIAECGFGLARDRYSWDSIAREYRELYLSAR